MSTHTVAPESPALANPRRVIVAASIGNALEWFDILVYGFFAATMAKLFFPNENETVSLLLALGTFAVSYMVRPLGGLVLGAYADRVGRKAALMLSIRPCETPMRTTEPGSQPFSLQVSTTTTGSRSIAPASP